MDRNYLVNINYILIKYMYMKLDSYYTLIVALQLYGEYIRILERAFKK